ncbi:ribosome-associated translation inhibitor RaiA [Sphingobacteriales bacterium UPWRP_1]|nr:ribosomal subunit interface protein [Sphingobacteriales bacterium TSM_CSS]PSJ74290.1 ribosome-associated translation inhibitor RaiA [Sphingobacteriales bacterium UPWRP_1]
MKITIQSVQFTAAQPLLDFVERKVSKLGLYFDRITDAEVYLTLDNKSSHIKDKVAKIKLNLPGEQMIATETNKVFEEAVDAAVESLKKQIERYKDKIRQQ